MMNALPNITSITIRLGEDGAEKTFRGRFAWTLNALIEAGKQGVTPLERPAPRWSHYVMVLRRGGVPVQTIDEKHGGAYSGRHGRYLLDVPVTVVSREVRQ